MKSTDIYEKVMMVGCFIRLKTIRNCWDRQQEKEYGIATIMDIGGPDYRSYYYVMKECESIITEMIPYLVKELLKEYNYSTQWYAIKRESAHVFSVKENENWAEYVEQHNWQQMFSFSCDDENHNGILYVFKEYGLINNYPSSLLDSIIKDYKLKDSCYISLVENDAYSEVLNHNNNESDPSRGTGVFSLKQFFDSFFDKDEYMVFKQYTEKFTNMVRDYFGFEIVRTLKPNTMHNFRKIVKEDIYNFKIHQEDIDRGISENQYKEIKKHFFDERNCELLTGSSDFAQSYMTSEWLFSSLKDAGNIDLTSIAMGYFKSIEQLLFHFIELHTYEKDMVNRSIYVGKGKRCADKEGNADLTDALVTDERITKNINMGALTGFFGYHKAKSDKYYHRNKDLLANGINDTTYECIIDTLSGIVGLRNGYFHKHNLSNWDEVTAARYSARLVFFLILGAYKISKTDKEELGIIQTNEHDDYYKLCEYMNLRSYVSGLETPIFYLNGETHPYDFWMGHQDDFIEYDNYGEPIYSGIYFGKIGDKQHFRQATRENLPTEIWEGVFSISRSVPITMEPSGPIHLVYKDGKFMK